jgi:tRNA nucleotidyltransferase (CCA-adding enzyme)
MAIYLANDSSLTGYEQYNEGLTRLCYNPVHMGQLNLTDKIEKLLPAELLGFLEKVKSLAVRRHERLYLVGGIVRDLLLDKKSYDLDLAVEGGDAISLAQELADKEAAEITIHKRFKTAKIKFNDHSIDIATTRRENYSRPGALPRVEPGSIEDDLFRRDFTVNAMAIDLSTGNYGNLIDHYGGLVDLKDGLIRYLYAKSFKDDATRIWRALRYEQRLGFKLESNTQRVLMRDITMLKTVSGDRIRYELECIFKEEQPEKVFLRAQELSVIRSIKSTLKGDDWLKKRFIRAREIAYPELPQTTAYLSLLCYRLNNYEQEEIITSLKLNKTEARVVRDTYRLKEEIEQLNHKSLKSSQVYVILSGYSTDALLAIQAAEQSSIIQKNIKLFKDKLSNIKSSLKGSELIKAGLSQGSKVKQMLDRLLYARLDGQVKTKDDEIRLVNEWLNSNRSS